MLMRICSRITEGFVQSDLLNQELSDWCIYWLQKKILTALVVSLMLILGSALFGAKTTICFLLGLLPLRRRLSGFHTKSPYTCMFLSVCVMLLSLLLHSILSEIASFIFSFFNFAICLAYVVLNFGNYVDERLHLTKEEISENNRLATCTLLFESVCGMVISAIFHSIRYLSACQIGISVVVLSSIYSKLQYSLKSKWGRVT